MSLKRPENLRLQHVFEKAWEFKINEMSFEKAWEFKINNMSFEKAWEFKIKNMSFGKGLRNQI